jgi:Animal haem peroxidase
VALRNLALSALLALPAVSALAAGEAERAVSPNSPLLASGGVFEEAVAAGPDLPAARFPEEFRTISGRRNNGRHRSWGQSGTPLARRLVAAYEDGVARPSGALRPSARAISNACVDQPESIPNSTGASGFLWQWGQFLDHDLSLTPNSVLPESFDIEVPAGDPFFDPEGTGTATIPLRRSAWRIVDGVRNQVNSITGWVDGSNVYGSNPQRARELRASGGRLRTSAGDLPMFNRHQLPNQPSDDPSLFLAGDLRANEQVALTAMHALFVREHNYWAAELAAAQPELSARQIYLTARALVGAELQAITYREFLPLLLGPHALEPYRGYDPTIDPRIANEFATAAFRVGHTMLPPRLALLDRNLEPVGPGPLPLRDAFFRPSLLTELGVEPFLRGLAMYPAQEIDPLVVSEVRNFLFGPPGAGGFDLASLNIQRGRDHGLPSLNEARRELGLVPYADFDDVPAGPRARDALAEIYGTVDDVDLWLGGLVERHVAGAMVGETFFVLIKDQFERVRDGDRFWYQSYLPPDLVRLVERRTLGKIIRSNTRIGHEIPADVFRLAQ